MSAFQNLPTIIVQKVVNYLLIAENDNEEERFYYLNPLTTVSSTWRNEALKKMCATIRIDGFGNCWFFAFDKLSCEEFLEFLDNSHLSIFVKNVKIIVTEEMVCKHTYSNELMKFIRKVKLPAASSLHLAIELYNWQLEDYTTDVESDHGYMSDGNTAYATEDESDSYNRDVDIRFKRNKKYESKVLRFIQYVKEMVPNSQKVLLALGSRFMRCFSKFDGMADTLYSIFEQVPDCSLRIYYSNYPRGALGLPGFKLSVLDIVCHDNNPRTGELIKCHADTLKELRILFTGRIGCSFITAVGLDEKAVYPNLKKICVIPYCHSIDDDVDINDTQDYIPFPKLRHLILNGPFNLVEPITRGNQACITYY